MASLPSCVEINVGNYNENCILFDDLLTKIIQNVPLAEWSRLELVSRQFRLCVQNAYRRLKTLDLKTVFLAEFGKRVNKRIETEIGEYFKNRTEREIVDYLENRNEKVFNQFFAKLIYCCPFLHSIEGFDCLLDEYHPYQVKLCHQVTSANLDLLCQLTELNYVSFKNVTVNIDDLSRFLKTFPNMKSLELCCCSINNPFDKEDEYFDFLGSLCALFELKILNYWHVLQENSGSFLSMINAEYLKVLDFRGCRFKGINLSAFLSRSVNLETLYLNDPHGLELQVLQCLPNLTKLHKFDLYIGKHDNEMCQVHLIDILAKCNSLKDFRIFNFEYNIVVTDDVFHRLIAECPLLESLDLSVNDCSNAEMVSNVLYLEHLTHLVIRGGGRSKLKGLCSKLFMLNNLSHLALFGDVDEAELVLLKNLKNLTHFSYPFTLTETVVHNWIESGFLKKLTFLRVFLLVADGIAKLLFENATNLKVIHYVGQTDDEILLTIGNCCKYLQKLDLRRGCRITEKGLLNVLLNSSTLRCLNVRDGFYSTLSSNALFQPFKYVVCCQDFSYSENMASEETWL